MNVRHATRSDVPAIAAVYREAWRAAYDGLLPSDVLDAEADRRAGYDWASVIDRPDRMVAVAEGPDIVGVVECEPGPPPVHAPWVHMLYVARRSWGTGAADALLDGAVEAVRKAGHPTAWLRVVEANSRARRFYQRQGWRPDPAVAVTSNGLFRLLPYRYDL